MKSVLWVQNEESGKDSYFFEGKNKIAGNDKKSFQISRFLSETKFQPIYSSRNGAIKEISKGPNGYFVSGLLLDKEKSGRRIPFSGYAEGNIEQVCGYFNMILGTGSKGIAEEDQKFIISTVKEKNNNKETILITGIAGVAVLSLITIYYFYYGKA